ncbi:MAG: hypothetical protein ACRD0A_06480, partial [Acidimicrobiales bacterium]
PRRRLAGAGAGLLLAVVVVFGLAAPPERCPAVSAAGLRDAAREAVAWFVRNQEPDGQWLYRYDATTDTAYAEYNVIRHGGVLMALYQAAGADLPGALASADRGVEWATDRLAERGDWTALRSGGELPVGATALLTAGLAERRLVTGDPTHDDLLRRLGQFLVDQIEPSGAVIASYDLAADRAAAGVYSRYYTGEAYWALTRLHQLFPDEGWGATADLIGAYMAGPRDDVEGYWPPLPDHWAAYGQAETVSFPERAGVALSDVEADYARRQAGLFGGQVRWLSQRAGPWGALVRGPFVPRGGGYGVIGEALTGLWLTSAAEPELADARPEIAARARCVAGLAVAAQADREEAADFAEPDRVLGAWFRDGETRMDDQQHALSGLLRTIPIVASGEGDGSTDGAGPSAWLWVALVVAGLNPFRAAFGVPRAARSRRDVALVAGLGGLIGMTAVVAAAAIGGPLVDAVGASEPAVRIGAGAVAAIVGLSDLLRPPPAPDPAWPGWRAALVPV